MNDGWDNDDYPDDDDPESSFNRTTTQEDIDLILGRGASQRLAQQLRKAKDRRIDQELARAMRNLDLNDDAMDIDANTASFEDLKLIPDEESGGYRVCVT